jgi:hypothetical protein
MERNDWNLKEHRGFMVGFKAWIGDKEYAALEMLITWSGDQVQNIWDLNLSF